MYVFLRISNTRKKRNCVSYLITRVKIQNKYPMSIILNEEYGNSCPRGLTRFELGPKVYLWVLNLYNEMDKEINSTISALTIIQRYKLP